MYACFAFCDELIVKQKSHDCKGIRICKKNFCCISAGTEKRYNVPTQYKAFHKIKKIDFILMQISIT